MASLTPVRRAAKRPDLARAPAPKDDKRPLQRAATPAKSPSPPAYLQAKLAISHPSDHSEQEADRVAAQVARSPRPGEPETPQATPAARLQRASLQPGVEADDVAPVPAARHLHRSPAPAQTPPTVHRKAAPDALAGQPASADTEARIEARRGGGAPLPDAARRDMEARFNQDFAAVRIHTDADAADLCGETRARAFTVGSDIFFAPGEFAPERGPGRELLAHELTHVVQQGASGLQRLQRDAAPGGAGDDGTYMQGEGYIDFKSLPVPSNYAKRYKDILNGKPLIRHKAFSEDVRSNVQQTTWRAGIQTDKAIKKLKTLADAKQGQGAPAPAAYIFKVPSPYQQADGDSPRLITGDLDTCAREAAIPSWDRQGRSKAIGGSGRTSYAVDHIVEQQVGAQTETGKAFVLRPELDGIDNLQLLTAPANTAKKNAIQGAVTKKVEAFLSSESNQDTVYRKKKFKDWKVASLKGFLSFRFADVTNGAEVAQKEDECWSRDDINAGRHVDALLDASPRQIVACSTNELEKDVPKDHLGILTGPSGGYKNNFPLTKGPAWSTLLKPFEVRSVEQNPGGGLLARLMVNVPARHKGNLKPFDEDKPVEIDALNGSDKLGYFTLTKFGQRMQLHQAQMSPMTLDTVDIAPGGGLVVEGRIQPTLPVIGQAAVNYRITGDSFTLSKTFTVSEINLPPPVQIDACSLTVTAGTGGLGAEGQIDLSVDKLGKGFLRGEAALGQPLAFTGGFDFDTRLFDRAHIELWYRDNAFGGAGSIAVDKPGKIRGIKKANADIHVEEHEIRATGSVVPDMPGVKQGDLAILYKDGVGLDITGTLQLASNAAIRSGTLETHVRERDDTWKVAATGTAQPAIPGLNSELTVGYDDGAFTAGFRGAFQRGMLSGTVDVGATNRGLDPAGQPTGDPVPGAPLIVYGGGSATLRLAPWLQGTAGLRFAPNGEVTVRGEIGLPSSLELFSRKEINKPLFSMSTQIPIVPGIVAEVGGNLSAKAGIGPGSLDQCRVGIEYNPAHEDQTHVTGDAHLNIPADAGLRLAARAGIGLGITGAAATGGLELGGAAGISGAAEASVHIDWMPTRGLQIDAEGYIHAEPKFRFDVSGYVSVTALGFSVYDNRWELAAVEVGSDLRLGARFPIHYREGQPFDVSLSDVQFEVPDIDAPALVRDVGRRLV